jgi:hypothetical protein
VIETFCGRHTHDNVLEHAQSMAAHESPLYDRTKERLTQDEIERIVM